jgi:hypothetical protein
MTPQPAKDFRERAAEVAREAPMDGPSTEIYWRVISTIDPAEVAALQSRYAADLVDFKPSGMFKYLDLPFWIWRQVGVARQLGLDHGGPRNILDIGMGAGHFAAVLHRWRAERVGSSALRVSEAYPEGAWRSRWASEGSSKARAGCSTSSAPWALRSLKLRR